MYWNRKKQHRLFPRTANVIIRSLIINYDNTNVHFYFSLCNFSLDVCFFFFFST